MTSKDLKGRRSGNNKCLASKNVPLPQDWWDKELAHYSVFCKDGMYELVKRCKAQHEKEMEELWKSALTYERIAKRIPEIKREEREQTLKEVFERLDEWSQTRFNTTTERVIAFEKLKKEMGVKND